MNNKAYIITASSGVGKTTHTRLWLSEFAGEASILNGDKPLVRMIDGKAYACGTPWKGKEGFGVNERARLRGIAFLERAAENSAAEVPADKVVMKLVTQMYMPKSSGMSTLLTMKLADRLIKSVKLVELKCNMDPSAAQVAYEALSPSNAEN